MLGSVVVVLLHSSKQGSSLELCYFSCVFQSFLQRRLLWKPLGSCPVQVWDTPQMEKTPFLMVFQVDFSSVSGVCMCVCLRVCDSVCVFTCVLYACVFTCVCGGWGNVPMLQAEEKSLYLLHYPPFTLTS